MLLAERRVTLNVSAFYSDIEDLQATTTAGTCSSRIVFNVPKARSRGAELELVRAAERALGFRNRRNLPGSGAALVGRFRHRHHDDGGGRARGRQSPADVRGFPGRRERPGSTQPIGPSRDLFANLTVQHVGSSYSQFENEVPNFGLIATNGLGRRRPGSSRMARRPCRRSRSMRKLPSYSLGNLRVGLRQDGFEPRGLHQQPLGRGGAAGARLRARPRAPASVTSPTCRERRGDRALGVLKGCFLSVLRPQPPRGFAPARRLRLPFGLAER